MTYLELIKENAKLLATLSGTEVWVNVLSNATLSPVKEILEFQLRKLGIRAKVRVLNGEISELISHDISHKEFYLVFYEVHGLYDGLWYRHDSLSDQEIEQCIEKGKREIALLFKYLTKVKKVYINSVSAWVFDSGWAASPRLTKIISALNRFIEKEKQANIEVVNIERIRAICGLPDSINWSHFYRSNLLYSNKCLDIYCQHIANALLEQCGKSKKVLVVDCDNTLWHGIVGEDGTDGISASSQHDIGKFYFEVQHLILSIKKAGGLICICSKNNPEDISEVFLTHPEFPLSLGDFALVYANWEDKAKNIQCLSEVLNISLDHMVFLDDSAFEVSRVKECFPSITTSLVPSNLYDYPGLVRSLRTLFINSQVTNEDTDRTRMYREEQSRQVAKSQFESLESYLNSLQLQITIYEDNRSQTARIAQLTNRTNQFNLTTMRFNENEIDVLMEREDTSVFSLSVKDAFGEYGLTGVAIVTTRSLEANIDAFLLSCRVLGRNIEFAFINRIIQHLEKKGVKRVYASFSPTPKNGQTRDFYPKVGFSRAQVSGVKETFRLNVNDFEINNPSYIGVVYEEKG